jgi:hypothetical protein
LADNWGAGAGGFINAGYRGNALSYIIGLDSGLMGGNNNNNAQAQSAMITGDRNMLCDAVNQTCSSGVNDATGIEVRPFAKLDWTNAVHGLQGNLGIMDGSVQGVTKSGLREVLAHSDDAGSYHILKPK